MQALYGSKIRIRTGLNLESRHIPSLCFVLFIIAIPLTLLFVNSSGQRSGFWTQDFQRGKTQKEYNEKYYEEILSVIQKYKNYSVLGHLDLIARYDKNGIYPFPNVKPLVEEILKTVITDGKGIEVNTSSYRYGLSDTTPSREILKLYKALGGKIITIGSDSHRPEHLGTYIKETKE